MPSLWNDLCGLRQTEPQLWQTAEYESAVSENLDTMTEGALQHQSWDSSTHT